jgi:ribosomal protein S18 acetylase RimI-like enzyme
LSVRTGGVTGAGPPAILVRPVLPGEHRVVADLTVSVYADVLGESLSDDYRVELEDVGRRAREALVLVAVDGSGRVLGSVTYVPGPGPYAEFAGADEAGIRMLVVAPDAQRRGVGSALVAACVARARRDGKARVSLHTTPGMTGAQQLYRRLGFRRAPDRDGVPEPGVALLGYVRNL